MKLATLRDGSRDGALILATRDGARFTSATDIARDLQTALDDWDRVAPQLQARADALERGEIGGAPLDVTRLAPPLPRAYEWIDGSAYLNHVRLVRKARNAEPPATLETDPLVYQGGSGALLGPRDAFVLPNPAWGLDFEAEVGVILGDTPLGTTAATAGPHVRLIVLLNDWTHRGLIPPELEKGFGFFQSKPATAFAPFAVTPDELGDAWKDAHAGPEMHFGFHELVQHLCKTRAYTAGTIVGSGTISNVDRAAGYSCIAEQRMIETIDQGKPATRWLQAGDEVAIEMYGDDGVSVFGRIEAKVTAP